MLYLQAAKKQVAGLIAEKRVRLWNEGPDHGLVLDPNGGWKPSYTSEDGIPRVGFFGAMLLFRVTARPPTAEGRPKHEERYSLRLEDALPKAPGAEAASVLAFRELRVLLWTHPVSLFDLLRGYWLIGPNDSENYDDGVQLRGWSG